MLTGEFHSHAISYISEIGIRNRQSVWMSFE